MRPVASVNGPWEKTRSCWRQPGTAMSPSSRRSWVNELRGVVPWQGGCHIASYLISAFTFGFETAHNKTSKLYFNPLPSLLFHNILTRFSLTVFWLIAWQWQLAKVREVFFLFWGFIVQFWMKRKYSVIAKCVLFIEKNVKGGVKSEGIASLS